MNKGIVAGIIAGAIWGLAFIAPRLIEPFGAVEITLARYLVFGLLSLLVFFGLRPMPIREVSTGLWIRMVLLGLCGNTLYFLLMSSSVQLAGSAATALVIGSAPVAMALVGNYRRKVLAWKRLIGPMLMIVLSLVVTTVTALAGAEENTETTGSASRVVTGQFWVILGVTFSLLSVAVWLYYGISNAEYLADHPGMSTLAWTSMVGIGTLVTLPPVAVVFGLSVGFPTASAQQWLNLLLWAVILGIGSSWIATFFWNRASSVLPAGILGALIASETVFAVIYDCIVSARWPAFTEILSASALLIGILWTVRNTRYLSATD